MLDFYKTKQLFEIIEKQIFDNIPSFPYDLDIFKFDKRFTKDWVVEHIKQYDAHVEVDGQYCYEFILDEFDPDKICHGSDNFVCSSDDIEEYYTPGAGNYNYYYGFITKDLPYLYHEPCEKHIFPTRVFIYGFDITVEIRTDLWKIKIYETVGRVRKLFYHDNVKMELKKWLKNTDRILFKI